MTNIYEVNYEILRKIDHRDYIKAKTGAEAEKKIKSGTREIVQNIRVKLYKKEK